MIAKKTTGIDKKIAGARIVIRLFSGLPNPQWALDEGVAREFLRRLKALPPLAMAKSLRAQAQAQAQAPAPKGKPMDTLGRPRSGYRGFSIYGPNSDKPIADYQIFRRLVLDTDLGKVLRDDSAETWESMLYATAPLAVRQQLEGVTIQQLTAPGVEGPIAGLQGPYNLVRCANAPKFPGNRASFNNMTDENHCYNWATTVLNQVSMSDPAIPGRNNSVRRFSVTKLRAALLQDKLKFKGMRQPKACPPAGAHYIAALVRHTASGRLTDIHFLRLDKTGRWSHKDGDNRVENTDDLGAPIRDLRQANFVGNCKLAGFYLALKSRRNLID